MPKGKKTSSVSMNKYGWTTYHLDMIAQFWESFSLVSDQFFYEKGRYFFVLFNQR